MLSRLCLSLFFVISSAHAADTLSAEQASRDARILVKAMSTLHPGLDKYRSTDEVAKSFRQFEQRAAAARSSAEMYLAATELAASVRCGHTWTNVLNQQGAIKAQLLAAPDKLPFTMVLVEQRFLVLASSVPSVAAGDEVLAINRHSATQIVATMMPYLRADGSSDGKRLRQLSHDRSDYSMMDILWPLLSPPAEGSYQVSLRRRDGSVATVSAKAVALDQRKAGVAGSDEWTLRIDGQRAILTLPTFSMHRSKLDWKLFLHTSFEQLRRARIPTLIIDIRSNEGGDGAVGLELLSYLVKEPFNFVSDQSVTTYERVPYSLARFLDTWDFSFFDRTGQVQKIAEGPQAGRYSFAPNAARARVIAPQAARYQGQVLMLVGAENSSATFALADLVKRSKAATLIGQATGGNQRGLNGGQIAWVTLPESGVAVDIPLLASTYRSDTPDASVAPDVLVAPSFAARAAGRDQEMEAAYTQSRYIQNDSSSTKR